VWKPDHFFWLTVLNKEEQGWGALNVVLGVHPHRITATLSSVFVLQEQQTPTVFVVYYKTTILRLSQALCAGLEAVRQLCIE